MKLPNRRQVLHLVVGSAALPALSRVARAQTDPKSSLWVPISNGTMVTLFGASYEAECGPNAVFRNGNAIKFILRPGESWPEDISSGSEGHRAELDGYSQIMSIGATYWCAWQFQLDAGPISRASWLLSRQYHNAYNHWINRPTQRIVFSKTGGNPIGSVPLVYGRVYSFVERIIPGTSGRVTTWVDGVQVADQAGAVTANRYPKFGLYGDRTDPVTLTARYDNFEFGTADLTAQITAPLVATPGWLI